MPPVVATKGIREVGTNAVTKSKAVPPATTGKNTTKMKNLILWE